MGTSWLPSYEALPGEVEGYHWDVDDLGHMEPLEPFRMVSNRKITGNVTFLNGKPCSVKI